MKINLVTETQVKLIAEKIVKTQLNKVISYQQKLNERLMKVEDEMTYRRQSKESKMKGGIEKDEK